MKPMFASDFIAHVHEICRKHEQEQNSNPDSYDAVRFYRGFIRDMQRVVDDVNRHVLDRLLEQSK